CRIGQRPGDVQGLAKAEVQSGRRKQIAAWSFVSPFFALSAYAPQINPWKITGSTDVMFITEIYFVSAITFFAQDDK
ncbi:MAG: hypothetical protein WAK55_06420, partial [Xanthobacteraceae bacterium]